MVGATSLGWGVSAFTSLHLYIVKLIGTIPSQQVLIRLLGADEHLYSSYTESMKWIEETDVLEMIVDKFSSSVSHFLEEVIPPIRMFTCLLIWWRHLFLSEFT